MKKLTALLLSVILLVAALAGCSSSPSSTPADRSRCRQAAAPFRIRIRCGASFLFTNPAGYGIVTVYLLYFHPR